MVEPLSELIGKPLSGTLANIAFEFGAMESMRVPLGMRRIQNQAQSIRGRVCLIK